MAKDIKFRVRLNVDGKEQLVTATTTVAEMRKAVRDTEKAFKGLNKTILNLNQGFEMVRNVGEGISQLTVGLQQAARQGQALTQLTGATGGDMRALRSEMEAVAATFGKDFGEVLRSVNALAKGFGIEAADALKLVREGFVVGADAGGDFLDTVREYPRYFKEAGLSAEDFIAISANATRQGVFSDKGVDAIKEANIRLREMTTATAAALDGIGISSEAVMQGLRDGSVTTFQVMQQVAARLKELPPSASEVGAAIADIFGGPGEDAGLEYIESLADVELSLGKVRDGARHRGSAHVNHARKLGSSKTLGMFDEVIEAHYIGSAKAQAMRLGGLDALDLFVESADDAHEVLKPRLTHDALLIAPYGPHSTGEVVTLSTF